ncbi:hypothetical protein GUJ93_ZPchr0009g1545 [Zizania palustris]|uniref:Uncharacterized protein n=1 Tax=Zizania palustris TaxID=103762 RepID=A0A8J5RB68_ZIZPA|nr:hypothetical protein GUJ93_ZPchr0009g1545 [Zizania palustris]
MPDLALGPQGERLPRRLYRAEVCPRPLSSPRRPRTPRRWANAVAAVRAGEATDRVVVANGRCGGRAGRVKVATNGRCGGGDGAGGGGGEEGRIMRFIPS